ncbi:hypothetical protein BD289DRAFT_379190, partial [Coniella lustricola]
AFRQRYRERLLDFHLDTLPYYKHRLQSRVYRYILTRQSRRLAGTRWLDSFARAAQQSRRLLLGPPPLKSSSSTSPTGDDGKDPDKMSQWGAGSTSGSAGGGYGADPYGSREPGTRRRKIAALAKSVYAAGVATASEIRNQYDNTRVRGVVDADDASYKISIPGSFPDVEIVTRGEEELVIFPSYAKRHTRQFRDDGSKIRTASEEDVAEQAQSDEDYWRLKWAREEDKKAVVDVDVRGWFYFPHRGPMTRKNRILIGLARRLSGIPQPTHQDAGHVHDLHTSHEEREELREQQKIDQEAQEIMRRGQAEKEAAVRGGYSERPQEDDSDGEGAVSVSTYRSSNRSAPWSVGMPSPSLSTRPTAGQAAAQELTEGELAVANANLMARLGPFLTTPMTNHAVTLFFYNESQSQSRTVETNDAGHFTMRAALDFVPTHVRVLANEHLSTVQKVEIIAEEGISVISDIDDTIKHSSIALGAREIFRNTFIRDLKGLTVDGVREWYGELHRMGVQFHYCSNSPWQLFPVIATFFRNAEVPPGSLHLKQYSGMLQGIFEPVAERKKGTLERILRDFPQRRFMLVGDSGEADLEVYTDLAVAHPGRILAIFIRDVTTPEQAGYFDAAVNGFSPQAPQRASSRSPRHDPRPNLPPRTLSEPPKREGPAEGTLIDFSDEPEPMGSSEQDKLEQIKKKTSGTQDVLSLDAASKKAPPPRPNKPAALKGEAAPGLSSNGNGYGGSISSNKSKNSNNQSANTPTSKPSPSPRSNSSVSTSKQPPPPPPPPRRRATPLLNLSPRSRALRHSNSNPDIEKLDLNGNVSLSSSSSPSLGPDPRFATPSRKLELWWRRLERARETLDRIDVKLYTWRRGEDVILEAVGLVRENAKANGVKR